MICLEFQKYRIYFNGTVETLDPNETHTLLLLGLTPNQISTSKITEDINQHNLLVEDSCEKICLSPNADSVFASVTPVKYQIPIEYLSIDLNAYVMQCYRNTLQGESESQIAIARINTELNEISKRGIEDLFKAIIFIVDRFQETNTVFGVGRGSSCACYVLFLIGLNLVDPLKYDIPIDEFFH